MRDIRASAAVTNMLGAENLHRLRHQDELEWPLDLRERGAGEYPTAERPFTRITTLLQQAARAGELAGGLVEAGWCVSEGGE